MASRISSTGLAIVLLSSALGVVGMRDAGDAGKGDCVDINTASLGKLKKVNGIGAALAKIIDEGRCYKHIEDVEHKLEAWSWDALKHLMEGKDPELCIQEGGYRKCAVDHDDHDEEDEEEPESTPDEEAEEDDESEGQKSRGEDSCVDVNSATKAQLKAIHGIGAGLANIIVERRCYQSMEKFEQIMLEKDNELNTNYWHDLEEVAERGELCATKYSWMICNGKKPHCPSDCHTDPDPVDDHADEEPVPPPTPSASDVATDGHPGLEMCDSEGRLPARRPLGAVATNAKLVSEMKYVLFVSGRRPKVTFIPRTADREAKCRQRFHKDRLTSSDPKTLAHSAGVCIMVKNEGQEAEAILYSEYNTHRNVPNFVAFRVTANQSRYKSSDCRSAWTAICPSKKKLALSKLETMCQKLVDYPFGPDRVTASGITCPVNDKACRARVDTRGHMAYVNAFSYDKKLCSGTMNFVNVFPSRNDGKKNSFDGAAWAQREGMLVEYVRKRGEELRKPLAANVLVGVSKESDGKINSNRRDHNNKPIEMVEVPSFAWTAVYDPEANIGTGWICRNGLSNDDPCYCVDGLSIDEIEARVGHAIFPELRSEDSAVDTSDGRHDRLYEDLAEKGKLNLIYGQR